MAKGRKTGGRRAATPNKIAAEVRAAILDAFVQVGGSSYLVRVANEYPPALCTLLGKILPHELATFGGPLKREVVLRWMTPEMARARGLAPGADQRSLRGRSRDIRPALGGARSPVSRSPPESMAPGSAWGQTRLSGAMLGSSAKAPKAEIGRAHV